MERQVIKNCIDSGKEYCPCHLAYSNNCITCNMLNDNSCCDCVWQGVCILNNINHDKIYKQNERKQYLCKVYKEEIEKDVYLMKISIPSELGESLYCPGAYIMLKSKENSDIFNTPISVMDIKDDILEVIVKAVGPKTKMIVKSEEVYVKGPYFNGIFGIENINKAINKNCMLILSGLSQVNSIKVVDKLIKNNNKVDVFINSDGILIDEVINRIISLGANFYYFDINDIDIIKSHIKENNIELVYSASSLPVSNIIRKVVDSVDENIKLSISNNNLICCGEGMCGACGIEINGEIIKTCKSQIDSRVFLDAKFR